MELAKEIGINIHVITEVFMAYQIFIVMVWVRMRRYGLLISVSMYCTRQELTEFAVQRAHILGGLNGLV